MSEEKKTTRNIYQRINAVQTEVSLVSKDTTVGYGNNSYKAVSHDGVLKSLRSSLVTHGIVCEPKQIGKGTSVDGFTNNGKPKIRFEAVFDVAFINMDNPEDKVVATVEAHADDSGDKAPGKAISYATKTAMLKVFYIETGENDEERIEQPYHKNHQKPVQNNQLRMTQNQNKQTYMYLTKEQYEATLACNNVKQVETVLKKYSGTRDKKYIYALKEQKQRATLEDHLDTLKRGMTNAQ